MESQTTMIAQLVSSLLILAHINYCLNIPPSCYEQTSLNGTECCNKLRDQCTFDEGETIFNCSHNTENLQQLIMWKCGLSGTIPNTIISLPYLFMLDLSWNFLTGSIPEIGEQTNLQYINLCHNSLEGSIPKSISNAKYLIYLDISNNKLNRMNLPSLSTLYEIQYLDLSDNDIAENFHVALGDFQRLQVLNLGTNRISSSIPYTIGSMTHLQIINLERNQMFGTLPNELSQILALKILNISDNKFIGEIPSQWGQNWGDGGLEYLNLGYNEFNCPVRDYSQWAQSSDFVSSYGQNGTDNCHHDNNITTTQIPNNDCLWNIGDNILNLTAFKNQTLVTIDNTNNSLLIALSPCSNLLTCNNKKVMSYRQDIINNECFDYLSIWQNGLIEPQYYSSIRSWEFVYVNGEKCDDVEKMFQIYWQCDYQTKNKGNIISFKQIELCTFAMHINSSYACS